MLLPVVLIAALVVVSYFRWQLQAGSITSKVGPRLINQRIISPAPDTLYVFSASSPVSNTDAITTLVIILKFLYFPDKEQW